MQRLLISVTALVLEVVYLVVEHISGMNHKQYISIISMMPKATLQYSNPCHTT